MQLVVACKPDRVVHVMSLDELALGMQRARVDTAEREAVPIYGRWRMHALSTYGMQRARVDTAEREAVPIDGKLVGECMHLVHMGECMHLVPIDGKLVGEGREGSPSVGLLLHHAPG